MQHTGPTSKSTSRQEWQLETGLLLLLALGSTLRCPGQWRAAVERGGYGWRSRSKKRKSRSSSKE
jgi:hypothetical protein